MEEKKIIVATFPENVLEICRKRAAEIYEDERIRHRKEKIELTPVEMTAKLYIASRITLQKWEVEAGAPIDKDIAQKMLIMAYNDLEKVLFGDFQIPGDD